MPAWAAPILSIESGLNRCRLLLTLATTSVLGRCLSNVLFLAGQRFFFRCLSCEVRSGPQFVKPTVHLQTSRAPADRPQPTLRPPRPESLPETTSRRLLNGRRVVAMDHSPTAPHRGSVWRLARMIPEPPGRCFRFPIRLHEQLLIELPKVPLPRRVAKWRYLPVRPSNAELTAKSGLTKARCCLMLGLNQQMQRRLHSHDFRHRSTLVVVRFCPRRWRRAS